MTATLATSAQEPIELSAEPLLQLGFGFWGSKVLMSAVELGVFAALVPGPLDLDGLIARTGLHRRAARDFLDTLVSLGLLDRADDRYSNTPLSSAFLDPARPMYLGKMADLCNHHLYADWGSLTEALTTGRRQRPTVSPTRAYTEIYPVGAEARTFAEAMTGASLPLSLEIAKRLPWGTYRDFADVGCAQGGVTVEVARANPHLRGIGVDLAPVQGCFEEYVAAAGLSNRLRFQAGDIFADPIPSVDVVILGHMLHGLDLAGKQRLLLKAHAALPVGGMLVVFDMMIDDDRRRNTIGLLMSLNMLLETDGGFDYTGAECLGWVREAGFRQTRIERLPGPQSMVIGIK